MKNQDDLKFSRDDDNLNAIRQQLLFKASEGNDYYDACRENRKTLLSPERLDFLKDSNDKTEKRNTQIIDHPVMDLKAD